MVLYVRELDEIDRERLAELASGADSALRQRVRVILLSAEGYRVPEIAQILGAHPANLRKWIHRYNENHWRGLLTVRSGGKSRFTAQQKAAIVALARTRPRDLGLNYTSWTLHKLAHSAQECGIVETISHECVRQILIDADCSYKHDLEPPVESRFSLRSREIKEAICG